MLSSHRLWPEPMELSGGLQHIGPGPAWLAGRMNWSTALANPSSSWDVVDVGGLPLHVRRSHCPWRCSGRSARTSARRSAGRRSSRWPPAGSSGIAPAARRRCPCWPSGGSRRGSTAATARRRPACRTRAAAPLRTSATLSWSSLTPTILTTPVSTPSKVATTVGSDCVVDASRSTRGGLTGPDVPVGRAVDPHVETVRLNGFHDRGHDVVGQRPLVEHGQVGEHDDAAVEGRHRHRQARAARPASACRAAGGRCRW